MTNKENMRKTFYSAMLLAAILFSGCTTSGGSDFFNGKNLSNWEFILEDATVSPNDVFKVVNGSIYIKGEPLGYMYTKDKYENYNLELEYKWDGEATNSGVFLIIEDPTNPFPKGIECQLMDQKAGDFVLLGGSDMAEYQLPEGETERPQFPVIERNTESAEKPAGEWNKIEISVYDGVIDVFVNGVHQNTGTSPATVGHIGLQSEGGGIYFRNLILTEVN